MIRLVTFALIIGCMHACGAHAATLTAAPCMVPKPHKHHAPIPVQSCVTPPVPMCFREPAPVDELPMPGVYPYYISTPVIYDEGGEGVWIGDETPTLSEPGFQVVGATFVPPTHRPTAIIGPFPRRISHAPEMDLNTSLAALTLLAGGICCIRGRYA